MKVGLVGWGIEAQSAYRYLGDEHNYVIVSEERRDDFPVRDNVSIYALDVKRAPGLVGNVADLSYLEYVKDCELIIYQPAARKNMEKYFTSDRDIWQKAKTIQHLFFEKVSHSQIIGVTGTKGKGTTSTLIARILESAGHKVHLVGNIGTPLLDCIEQVKPEDWVVLELSSFQLYKFPYSPHIAVHLMMMPEHIEEWHKTMDDYVQAKANICAHQTPQDFVVYFPYNEYSTANAKLSPGQKIPYTAKPGAYVDEQGYLVVGGSRVCRRTDFRLLGAHNEQNICAAVTAYWQVSQNTDAIVKVVSTFSGLEHRLELAGTVDEVRYYDDSFGTTPDTAIVAMDAFEEPKVMITGGHDKGNPMQDMIIRLCQADIRHIVFIGSTGKVLSKKAIEAGLNSEKVTVREDGNSWKMEEIVAEARKHAQSGDVVLLSTGSASFGLFKDYKDRGSQFKQSVQVLV